MSPDAVESFLRRSGLWECIRSSGAVWVRQRGVWCVDLGESMVAANGDAWVRMFLADLDRELAGLLAEIERDTAGADLLAELQADTTAAELLEELQADTAGADLLAELQEIERQAGQAVAAWRGSVSRLVAEIDGGGSER